MNLFQGLKPWGKLPCHREVHIPLEFLEEAPFLTRALFLSARYHQKRIGSTILKDQINHFKTKF